MADDIEWAAGDPTSAERFGTFKGKEAVLGLVPAWPRLDFTAFEQSS